MAKLQEKDLQRLPADRLDKVRWIATEAARAGGRALLVGGCVRDLLLGLSPADLDVEVYGLEATEVEALLTRRFRIATVGRAFGVFKIRNTDIDVSLPRRESQTGDKHTDFKVEGDPRLTPEEASLRRDFTVNAMMLDPATAELVDPHGGQRDLEQRVLRAVSDKFSEDALRVLRGMQFAARFGLEADAETLRRCRELSPEHLSPERIFEEWRKLILKGEQPSIGLTFLKDCGWTRFFPELDALIDCPQDPEWHPEGDVWTHTLHCLDAYAQRRVGDNWEDLVVGLAVLLHDVGKPATTFLDEDGRIRSPKHEHVGLKPAEAFLRRMTAQSDLIEEVLVLIETHMRPNEFYKSQAGDAAIRRLAHKVGRIDRLLRVVEADMNGRPPMPADDPASGWLLERAQALAVEDAKPQPILLGRHLIERGYKPSPAFGRVLEACFDAQLEGAFSELEGAEKYLDTLLQENSFGLKKD